MLIRVIQVLKVWNLVRVNSLVDSNINQISLKKVLVSSQKGIKILLICIISYIIIRCVYVSKNELNKAIKLTEKFVEYISFKQPRKVIKVLHKIC